MYGSEYLFDFFPFFDKEMAVLRMGVRGCVYTSPVSTLDLGGSVQFLKR